MTLTLDGDASARLWIQDDTGSWHLITQTNDTDTTKTNYTNSNYFVHRIGDANDDAQVDTTDFTTMAQNFNQSSQSFSQGDFNGDGNVNALDFNALATNFGTSDPRPAKHNISGLVNFFEPGVRYSAVVEYSDKVNRATIRLLWASPSRSVQEVPLDRLYASTVATSQALSSQALNLFSANAIAAQTASSIIGE